MKRISPLNASSAALGWIGAVLSLIAAGVATFWIGVHLALLILAGAVLVAVVALFWSSLQSLAGESELSLDEALSLAAPSAEEEQKQSMLRILKDLEYERSVGKISDADYAELSTRYRAEAKRLLSRIDRSLEPAVSRAEALLQERLARAGVEPRKTAASASPDPRPGSAE